MIPNPYAAPSVVEAMSNAVPRNKREKEAWLDGQVEYWYDPVRFPVETDPLGVVRTYLPSKDPRCVEAAAFFAALFAWGRRDIAIAKTEELLVHLITQTERVADAELRAAFADTGMFKHRTFTQPQVKVLVLRLQDLFDEFGSMEAAFARFAEQLSITSNSPHARVEQALNGFRQWFFAPAWAASVSRHVASPEKGSACKRLNLMLRWLIRPGDKGLDLGLWKAFTPSELVIPLDVHVINSARHLGMLARATINWQAATELTEACRRIRPTDPVVLDYALFGLSNAGFWPKQGH